MSGAADAGGVAPLALGVAAAVDPDGRHPQVLGRDVVVEEALGDVQDPLPRHVDRLERELEVVEAGLVAPRLLGGHDPVELRPELLARAREEVAVAVRDDAEPEALGEARQGGGGVRERRPVADRVAERGRLGVGCLHAVVGADPAQRTGHDVAVAQVRAALELGLVPAVGLEELLVAGGDAVRVERRPQAGEDAALPVDERAVAVEREGVEVVEADGRHGAVSCQTCPTSETPGRPCGPRSCATRPASASRPVRTRCRSARSRPRRASRSPRPASSRSPCSPGRPSSRWSESWARAGRRAPASRPPCSWGREMRSTASGSRRSSRVSGLRRLGAAHLVIDESTAMATARDDPRAGRLGFWATGLAVFVCWNTGTAIGAAGRERPRRSALARPRRGSARRVPRARRAAAPASRDGDRSPRSPSWRRCVSTPFVAVGRPGAPRRARRRRRRAAPADG